MLWGIEPAISVGSKNVAGAGGGCTVGPPNVGVGSRSFKGTEPVCTLAVLCRILSKKFETFCVLNLMEYNIFIQWVLFLQAVPCIVVLPFICEVIGLLETWKYQYDSYV